VNDQPAMIGTLPVRVRTAFVVCKLEAGTLEVLTVPLDVPDALAAHAKMCRAFPDEVYMVREVLAYLN